MSSRSRGPRASRQDAPGPVRADRRRPRPRGQIRPVQVEDVLGREPVEVDLDAIASYLSGETVLVTGAGGSIGSELCRQIARVGAGAARPRRPLRGCPVRDRARTRRRARFPGRACPCSPTCKNPAKLRAGLRDATAPGRLPRGRVQARAADGGQPGRGGAQQHRSRRGCRRGRGRVRRRALRADLDRQGRQPEDGDGPVEGALRVDRRGATAHRDDVATRFVAVRFGNVLGSSGSRDPDLPPADRARRPGHGHAPGDDALLHDDPRGGLSWSSRPARSAAGARSSCSTWASRSRSSSSRAT